MRVRGRHTEGAPVIEAIALIEEAQQIARETTARGHGCEVIAMKLTRALKLLAAAPKWPTTGKNPYTGKRYFGKGSRP